MRRTCRYLYFQSLTTLTNLSKEQFKIVINNTLFSFMIHVDDEGSDHCKKYSAMIVTFITCRNHQSLSKINVFFIYRSASIVGGQ